MSMLLTLSSGVVALRSHHTYRLQRGWLHKIPYKRVPEDMEAEVLKYVMKPHLHPLHDCIFHLMTFMSYYDGKYTYMTWSHLYTQYLHKYWNIKKDIKDKKMKTKERGSHDLYDEPGVVGRLGGVA
ncbi:hypothetical protein pdam_00024789, partial [Pocillopora damicornis]